MSQEPQKQPSKKQQFDNYVKYTQIALQMLVIIALGVFGGVKLDDWINAAPLFTILLSLAGVAIAIYIVIRTFLKEK